MEILKQEELMKSRGYGATLNESYRKFSGNLKTIVRHLWPYALVLSLVVAAYVLAIQQAIVHPQLSTVVILGISAMASLNTVAVIAFYARAMMLVNGKKMTWNVVRTIKIALWIILIELVVTLVVGIVAITTGYLTAPAQPDHPVANEAEMLLTAQQTTQAFLTTIGITLLAVVIITLLLLPLVYTFFKYYLEPETHFLKILGKSYRCGLRHWGYMFVTELILLIAVGLVCLVVCLPLAVLFASMFLSASGVAQGDLPGMPSHFGWLLFFTTALTYFILSFIYVYCIFANCYLYGSIETREKERLSAKTKE
ncbi:MAG: hypothetical protein J5719_04120 [Bacteroidales bacterium]|nr:hypothetical protein [Bacteroidales bacterium]